LAPLLQLNWRRTKNKNYGWTLNWEKKDEWR
jgi:hypothetical protein